MSKIDDSNLNALHEVLAAVLVEQVEARAQFTDEDGVEHDISTASPAMLAVAAKFLKDNNITCSVEDDTNLGRLDELLSNKTKKGRATLASVSPIDEATKAQEN